MAFVPPPPGFPPPAPPPSGPPGAGPPPPGPPPSGDAPPARPRKDRVHYLYIAVLVAVLLGVLVGLLAPGPATELEPLGTGFVALIKMMISPIIFCTIVLGIGSVARAAQVGKVGLIALVYFLTMSTFALLIGLAVGNLLHPGEGVHLDPGSAAKAQEAAKGGEGTADFLLGVIPTTLVSALTSGEVLQTLLVALLAGFALQRLGPAGEPVRRGVEAVQRWIFRILAMIMWAAPVGAFGAIAAVVGETGWAALRSLAVIMLGFYLTCVIFVFAVLGTVLWLGARVGVWSLLRYLAREFLLILSTSSSESALPRLIAKMEHLGVARPVVGITVPTGYSFNLDGTAIYLTMATLFIAAAQDEPLPVGSQLGLLLFMIIASKGAAGVSGAGLATLAGGLQSHRPELVDGVGFIVGIDRFMSEARALTNFAGNAVATVLVGAWTGQFDRARAARVFAGEDPFDETAMLDEHAGPGGGPPPAAAFPGGGPADRPYPPPPPWPY
ncbi:cation:dicarboxylate symporter family transporter [Spirillospora sp. CA-253888]